MHYIVYYGIELILGLSVFYGGSIEAIWDSSFSLEKRRGPSGIFSATFVYIHVTRKWNKLRNVKTGGVYIF